MAGFTTLEKDKLIFANGGGFETYGVATTNYQATNDNEKDLIVGLQMFNYDSEGTYYRAKGIKSGA